MIAEDGGHQRFDPRLSLTAQLSPKQRYPSKRSIITRLRPPLAVASDQRDPASRDGNGDPRAAARLICCVLGSGVGESSTSAVAKWGKPGGQFCAGKLRFRGIATSRGACLRNLDCRSVADPNAGTGNWHTASAIGPS